MTVVFRFLLNAWGPPLFRAGSFVIACCLLGALLTHTPHDPSWNVATPLAPRNWMGLVGAKWSDALLQTFGVLAYALPVFWLCLHFQGHAKEHKKRTQIVCFVGGFLLLNFALAYVANNIPQYPTTSFPLGGVLGATLQLGIQKTFHLSGIWIGFVSLCAGFLGVWMLFLGLGGRFSWLRYIAHLCMQFYCLWRDLIRPYRGEGQNAGLLRQERLPVLDVQDAPQTLSNIAPTSSTTDEVLIPEEACELPPPETLLKDYENPLKKRSLLGFGKGAATPKPSPIPNGGYALPPLSLLPQSTTSGKTNISKTSLEETAQDLSNVLDDFGVRGEIVHASPGPVVTLYELQPAAGLKSSRVIGLADDIARSMSALSARVAVVPGRNIIGIELPNKNREMVLLQDLLASKTYQETPQHLPLVLGKNIGGAPVIADLTRMPHLLVAGTTGSGKSVGINAMIVSLLFRLSPEQCRFIMIDPKMLELSVYDGIPHLLTPVVTDPKKAIVALKWVVREMENRYRAMAQLGVRNVEGYNRRLQEAKNRGETLDRKIQTGFDPQTNEPLFEIQEINMDPLPFIVVVVDEMADLMLVAGKEIEAAVQRLAQMARAAGIHLIMATQRPSVDVITGTIKANFPTRISFQVTSKIDSRTILGEQGAEQLLGQGDMLYMASGGRITRVHGPFVSDKDVEQVVRFLKSQQPPVYVDDITTDLEEGGAEEGGASNEGLDPLYEKAVALVCNDKKASTSYIQRQFQIGYNRAARIMDQMESQGVVSEPNHVGKREILL